MPAVHELFQSALPRLTADNYRQTSPAAPEYNCIAWAVGATDAWWWPSPGRFWPAHVLREETLDAFLALFAALGYTAASTPDLEADVEKVALYAIGHTPTHTARQLPDGRWTSKLGPNVDIEHNTPDAVAGGLYGEVSAILSRISPRPAL